MDEVKPNCCHLGLPHSSHKERDGHVRSQMNNSRYFDVFEEFMTLAGN